MNIHPNPEQERIVNDELRSGHFQSAEEVIAKALVALRESERSSVAGDSNGHNEGAVREMLNFAEANRTPLHGVSVKQLIRSGCADKKVEVVIAGHIGCEIREDLNDGNVCRRPWQSIEAARGI